MAGYNLRISILPHLTTEAKQFFRFLRIVGRKYTVQLRYRTTGPGKFYVTLDATHGAKIDSLLQELILNKGLYYYACSIPSRNVVTRSIIKPVFQELLESRFERTYPRLLCRHILGKSTDLFMPGDFYDASAHRYEMLFRKWDLLMICNYEFVRDLDDLLTELLLQQLGYTEGQKSPKFDSLLNQFSRRTTMLSRKVKRAFEQAHQLRTRGLHRQEKDIELERISTLALDLYFFFEYWDEYQEAQSEITIMLNGSKYKRIKHGDEIWFDESGNKFPDSDIIKDKPCGDCNVANGNYHVSGCDIEQCPRCKGQALSCSCAHDG